MFGKKNIRWLKHGDYILNLDYIDCFKKQPGTENAVRAYFNGEDEPVVLSGVTLADIHHILKHGKPRP